MEKDVNFNIVSSFLCFFQIFAFKNALEKTPKLNIVAIVFGTSWCAFTLGKMK
jgi:hypothetical protein